VGVPSASPPVGAGPHLSDLKPPSIRLVAMYLPRPCIDCQALTPPGQSRCPKCFAARRAVWDRGSIERRKARIRGGGAQRKLRRKINKQGAATCNACQEFFFAQDLEIDHRRPLSRGGADIDDNVQALCTPCHHNKSISEYHSR
jgi:5-methylcytosine-specific restriction protein A